MSAQPLFDLLLLVGSALVAVPFVRALASLEGRRAERVLFLRSVVGATRTLCALAVGLAWFFVMRPTPWTPPLVSFGVLGLIFWVRMRFEQAKEAPPPFRRHEVGTFLVERHRDFAVVERLRVSYGGYVATVFASIAALLAICAPAGTFRTFLAALPGALVALVADRPRYREAGRPVRVSADDVIVGDGRSAKTYSRDDLEVGEVKGEVIEAGYRDAVTSAPVRIAADAAELEILRQTREGLAESADDWHPPSQRWRTLSSPPRSSR